MSRIVTLSLSCLVALAPLAAMGAEPAASIDEQAEALKALFLGHYTPVEYTVEPNAPQLELPLDLSSFAAHEWMKQSVESDEARKLLAANGFVVVPGPGTDLFEAAYEQLKDRAVPIVVTSDSVLHLYHVLFDNTLKEIEEETFSGNLQSICGRMAKQFDDQIRLSGRPLDPIESEAEKMVVAYFSVALCLLDPNWEAPDYAADVVGKELALIDAHTGFAVSPLFGCKEDYSQYVPRGHYTQSDKLKRYFKAMMWFGRMTFLLKGNNDEIHDALVDEHTAIKQTLAALMIATALEDDAALHAKWKRLYTVTAFFVGFADDLTIGDYLEAYHETANMTDGDSSALSLLDEERLYLAKKRSPLIYGGTGLAPVEKFTDEEVLKNLEATKGMRFMGQRFVPDSYVMGRLVNLPWTHPPVRGAAPFTLVMSDIGPIRGFPRGLDVMHVLGSERALAILTAEGDTDYKDYAKVVAELRTLFDGFDQNAWHQNLYWGWLALLRTLLSPFGEGYPSFMQTAAYTDKALNASLASWSQLRHDTILYAKQSYSMVGSAMPIEPETEPDGYVEPVPALYAELIALNAMTHKGLDELGVLSREMGWRLERTDRLLRTLLDVSIKELEAKPLTTDDLRFIKGFGESLSDAIGDLTDDVKRTTIVADVHTDPNSGLVLEEGTGPVDLMWVVWRTPEGKTVAGAGPVLSYYEFKQPMGDRLTDEKWRKMLKAGAPDRAAWMGSFAASGE